MPEDRVQVPSFRKDGTPDQTENFEIIGDKDIAKEAIATSLAQNKTAAAGEARAQAAAEEEAELSPEEQARKDEVDGHVADAESEAESLVEARWVDPASRQSAAEETTTRSSRRRASASESSE